MRLPWGRREPAPPGPLRDLEQAGVPDRSCPLDELPLLAVDLETTGLDPARDQVVAVGWVPVDGRSVTLAGAVSRTVRVARDVGGSAGVHGLTDDVVAACAHHYGARPRLTAVDTVRLQRKVLGLPREDPGGDRLRLDAARRRFGLPRYRAHDALTDALACAELYLAQTDRIAGGRRLTLGDLLVGRG